MNGNTLIPAIGNRFPRRACPSGRRAFLLLCGMILLQFLESKAQEPVFRETYATWEEFMEEYADGADDDEDGEARRADWMERLEELHAAPLNLNTATRDDLLQLPFLDSAQADSILAYRDRKGRIQTLGELLFIWNIGYEERRWASLFAYAGDTLQRTVPLGRRLGAGRHEIETRLDVPLYRRAGNRSHTTEELLKNPNLVYLGNGLAHTVRYRYRWRRDVAYGITLQKDAGEPFGQRGNVPYDYVSPYFHYRAPSRRFEAVIGDYDLRMGQGLLFGRGLFGGKPAAVASMPSPRTGFRPHTSTNETDFFRGAAAALRRGAWSVMAFASFRRLDATTRGDTATAFQTSGLHRTLRELERRRSTGNCVAGGHAAYGRDNWHVGAGGFWSGYTRTVWPPMRDYNRYYLRGRRAAGLSAEYAWRSRRWQVQGEAAWDRRFHAATTHVARFQWSDRLTTTAQFRWLSPRFVSPHGEALQENSHTANEVGLLLGAKFIPLRKVEATAYVDLFRFPHATYRAAGPACGVESFLQATYRPGRRFSLMARYRLKSRQQDITGYAGWLEYARTHRLRLQAAYATGGTYLHLAADASIAARQTAPSSAGWMLSARARHRLAAGLTLAAFAAVFLTDDYASRVYAYEPQLRYAAGFPAFAYRGLRCVALCDWEVRRNLHFGLRYGLLHYFNRHEMGTGTQLIAASSKNDLSLQFRWLI